VKKSVGMLVQSDEDSIGSWKREQRKVSSTRREGEGKQRTFFPHVGSLVEEGSEGSVLSGSMGV